MDLSARLSLPFLAAGQASKHVTMNEALRRLDALVQLRVLSASRSDQPAAPNEGDGYILPSGASGSDWDAFSENTLAVYQDGAWEAFAPAVGWRAWADDQNALLVWDGQSWNGASSATREGLGLGPNDAVQFGAVRSPRIESVADDAIALVATPEAGGFALILQRFDGVYPDAVRSAIVAFDTGPSLKLIELANGGGTINIIDGDLTGATGPDGAMNIGRRSGALVIENRSGVEQSYLMLIVG